MAWPVVSTYVLNAGTTTSAMCAVATAKHKHCRPQDNKHAQRVPCGEAMHCGVAMLDIGLLTPYLPSSLVRITL